MSILPPRTAAERFSLALREYTSICRTFNRLSTRLPLDDPFLRQIKQEMDAAQVRMKARFAEWQAEDPDGAAEVDITPPV